MLTLWSSHCTPEGRYEQSPELPLLVQLVKVLHAVNAIAYTTLNVCPERRAQTRRVFSVQHIHQLTLAPHDLDKASFLLFSNREMKKMAASLIAHLRWTDAGPSSSSSVNTS